MILDANDCRVQILKVAGTQKWILSDVTFYEMLLASMLSGDDKTWLEFQVQDIDDGETETLYQYDCKLKVEITERRIINHDNDNGENNPISNDVTRSM